MTTFIDVDITCAECGKTSKHYVLMSTNTMSPPDLDLRPGEMKRSTMDMWVQRCPHCGYCASSIDEKIVGASEILRSERYRDLAGDMAYPELARNFLCSSVLQENARQYVDAGWSALYAAWTCDDENAAELASACRERASSYFLQALEEGQKILKGKGESEALIADVLRRCGKFDAAKEICEKGLSKGPGDLILDLLEFELALIEKRDTGLYRVCDLPKYQERENDG